jgi:hypothetical protein
MTVETATLIHELNSALPDPADGLTEGDNHIRLLKSAIKATFPNINAAITATDETLNNIRTATASLDALAALTPAADRLPYFTGASAAALATFSAFARTLVDDVDATAARTTLGLGALAVKNTVATADHDNDSVTFAKMQNINTSRLLGRTTAAAGDIEEISVGSGLALAAGVLSSSSTVQAALFQDQKADGTAGGGSTTGSWQTRVLNTSVFNNITGASLASNQVTLATAGTYVFYGVGAFFSRQGAHRIRNVSDNTTVATGPSGDAATSGLGFTTTVLGVATIASSKTFQLQYSVDAARATDGLGQAAAWTGEVEVYASLLIVRIA